MEPKIAFCLSTVCVGVIIIVILVIISFGSVEVNELALDYSGWSLTIAKEPLLPGIQFLGVLHSLIRFPSTV
jgi:hypothetical protein